MGTKHFRKNSLITVILIILLLLISMRNPLTVRATEGIGNESGWSGGIGNASGDLGSYTKTGYLVYVVNSSGELCSHVAFVSSGAMYNSSVYNDKLLISRIGEQVATTHDSYAEWGYPFDSNQHGRGAQIKNELLQKTYDGVNSNASWVVSEYVSEAYDLFKNDPDNTYLVLEACTWHQVWGGKAAGARVAASQTGWAKLGMASGVPGIWPRTNWVENCALTVGMYMDATWPGLPPAVTRLGVIDNQTILTAGYGMVVVRGNEANVDGQTTCDETKGGEPSKPAEESKGSYKIVKSYRILDKSKGTYTDKGTFVKPDSSQNIIIEQESDYKVINWKTSTTYKPDIVSNEWEKTVPATHKKSGNGSNLPKSITLNEPAENTLYILLQKEIGTKAEELDGNYVISESTITRQVNFSKPDSSKSMTLIQDIEFNWTSTAHKDSCDGHTYEDGKDSEGNIKYSTAYCSWGTWTDDKLQFTLKNSKKEDFPDILATKTGWENVTTLGGLEKRFEDKTRTEVGEASFPTNDWDYACVLLRGKDKLTVANWKNSELNAADANTELSGVSNSGFAVANTDSGDRQTADYYEQFTGYFEDDSPDKDTTRAITSGSGHGDCGDDTQTASLESNLDVDVKVKLETYSGSAGGGTNDTTCSSEVRKKLKIAGFNKSAGKEVPSGGTVSFRPYIQMNYDTFTEYQKKAYVLGEYQRAITPNDYAEISWNKQGTPNLKLMSLQWSTHASTTDFIVENFGYDALNEYKVLPGGATLSLMIPKENIQEIQLTTYQCIVTGSGKEQIDKAGGSDGGLTEEKAIENHKNYVLDVIETLDKVNVEQWVTKEIDSESAWKTGSAVGPGLSLKDAGHNSQKGSTEEKYYFRGEGELPDSSKGEGDLDVTPNPLKYSNEQLDTKATYYTFFVNTYGEIRYTENDIYPNTNGEERAGKLANDTIAKLINNRTHIVDKLAAAVERGSGTDTSGRSKTGMNWYNEAFDGITVIVQKTTLELGYREPFVERTSVMDPRLTQESTGKKDQFNFNKYNKVQYRTKNYSDRYKEDNKIGVFKGYDIYMDEMNMLYWSYPIFLPNLTTQDLH